MTVAKLEKNSNFDTLDERVKYLNGANWINLSGNFTPNELRKIARKIESRYKKVPKAKSKH